MLCGMCVYCEVVTRHSLLSAGQSSVPVSPSQYPRQSSCQRPQLPDYELAVQRLNEQHRHIAAVVKHSRVHSLDSMRAEPD